MPETELVRIGADDWREFREVRLASLADAPEAFGSTYVDWVDAPEERWRSRLTDVPLTVVARREGRPVGVVSGSPTTLEGDDAVELISMWEEDAELRAKYGREGVKLTALDALLSDPAIEAVFVESPVRDHARQRTFSLEFDQLHVATGARPAAPDLPGIDLDHVHGVQTLDDARDLLDHARLSRCRSVGVVGGGYIGLEMAEAFVRRGAEVTLLEGSAQLMATLDEDVAHRLLRPMRDLGIDFAQGHLIHAPEPYAELATRLDYPRSVRAVAA